MSTTGQLRKLGPALCLIAGLAAFGSGFAQDGGVDIKTAAFQEVVVTAADGTATTRQLPVSRVVPADVVVYEISYRNRGASVATDVAIDNPIPDELTFIDAETPPTLVSVDGGQAFGELRDLTVIDAEGNVRAAQWSDVTDIRWVIASMAPGSEGKLKFRVRVK